MKPRIFSEENNERVYEGDRITMMTWLEEELTGIATQKIQCLTVLVTPPTKTRNRKSSTYTGYMDDYVQSEIRTPFRV